MCGLFHLWVLNLHSVVHMRETRIKEARTHRYLGFMIHFILDHRRVFVGKDFSFATWFDKIGLYREAITREPRLFIDVFKSA